MAELILQAPKFKPEDPEMYLNEVNLWWKRATNLGDGRCLVLINVIPSKHPSGFKEYLVSQNTIDEYKGVEDKQRFLDCFDTMFAKAKRVKIVFSTPKLKLGAIEWNSIDLK